MKKIFALTFLLSINYALGQEFTVKDVVVYDWSELKDVKPDTIYGVSFQKMKLVTIPEELAEFKNLRVLNLSKNKLSSIPKFIGEFEFLEELNLTRNKLEYYPIELCSNQSIRILKLGQNLFETIPNCIESLEKLEYLDVYDTPISSLPESITQLKQLKKIDFTGIRFSPVFQESWTGKLRNVELIFDAPCDCFE